MAALKSNAVDVNHSDSFDGTTSAESSGIEGVEVSGQEVSGESPD